MENAARIKTPATSIDAALWITTLPDTDIAYLTGACIQRLASLQGVTEADLYADFAQRAANDPDCHVIRPA